MSVARKVSRAERAERDKLFRELSVRVDKLTGFRRELAEKFLDGFIAHEAAKVRSGWTEQQRHFRMESHLAVLLEGERDV